MSRRKRPSSAQDRSPTGPSGGEQSSPPTPRPPRRNRVFLAITGLLLAAWIAFLAAMALQY